MLLADSKEQVTLNIDAESLAVLMMEYQEYKDETGLEPSLDEYIQIRLGLLEPVALP